MANPGRPALVKQRLQPLLAESDQQAALKLIRREVNTGLAEQSIAGEYLLALNGIIDRSRVLMKQGEYSLAGQLLQTAQEAYPESSELAKHARLPLEELKDWRTRCADALMEQGLVAYRREDLDGALNIWQQILVFDPEHPAASKAVRTTEMQLANLRRMEHQ